MPHGASSHEWTYASIPRRFLAFGADYLIIALYLTILTLIRLFLIPDEALQPSLGGPAIGQPLVFLLLTLPVLLYFTFMESSSRRGTIGKRILHLTVVTVDHSRLTRSRALARAVLKFLPWELSHSCLWRIPGWPLSPQEPSWIVYAGFALVWALIIAYILNAAFSTRRQMLYDRLLRCVVIRST
jgi:uncharacterized RDD family membrane protein YckC